MQETNLYTITFPPMEKALRTLHKLLDKVGEAAERTKLEWHPKEKREHDLLNDRLVFDQFPLLRQVQIACDNAKAAAGHLGGLDVPKHEDSEKTVAELKARIDKTLDFLKTVKPENIIGKEGVKVQLRYWPGKHMTGFEYATEYLIPNFFFHVTTAYSILRKNGLPIGKSDYTGGLPLKDL